MENYLSVTALTKYIKVKLEGDKHLRVILIKGEISNFKHHSRGHFYFTLKDEHAQVSCIMFSRDTRSISFTPKDGDHVLIVGQISVYQPAGTYSIQVRQMKLDGIGELYLKYEALKKDLTDKGWFDDAHKKSIPLFPKRIGVITSSTGAVIEDIKNTVSRRYLLTEIYLYPALVQGSESSMSIARQIVKANERQDVDVLIVGRGGGSIEDLWGFNEMPTIEAIYHSKIPIITAIGHETDFTLSDFVSDLRAPTPTAAAELATPNKDDLFIKINDLKTLNEKAILRYLNDKTTMMSYFEERLEQRSPSQRLLMLKDTLNRYDEQLNKFSLSLLDSKKRSIELLQARLKHPIDKIVYFQQKQHQYHQQLMDHMMRLITQKQYQFHVSKTSLEGNNPLRLMDKGYTMVRKNNQIVSSIQTLSEGDELSIDFKDGIAQTKVIGKKDR